MSKTDSQLEAGVIVDENRSKRCGWVVVAGLVLEVILTAVFPAHEAAEANRYLWFIETWGAVFADALVALGVYGEIFFAGRVRKSEDELRRRSNDRVAEAIERAAAFEKEAAELRKRAADLEQITAWRKISAQEKERMVEVLTPAASNLLVFVEYQNGDMEAFTHAIEIAKIFISAGAKVSGHLPNSWMQALYGLSISVSPDSEVRSSVIEAFKILESRPVFEKQWERQKMWPIPPSAPRPNVLIAVYPKPPPLFMIEAYAAAAKST
jgi:hypothetical protein